MLAHFLEFSAGSLVWCSRNSLNSSDVIPGKLAIASATRNPGKLLDTRFRGYDGGALAGLFCEL